MSFRKNVIVFCLSLVAAALALEWSGFRETLGVSWGETLSIIPAEIAVPILLFVGVMAVWNP